jgi:hypothetical protein
MKGRGGGAAAAAAAPSTSLSTCRTGPESRSESSRSSSSSSSSSSDQEQDSEQHSHTGRAPDSVSADREGGASSGALAQGPPGQHALAQHAHEQGKDNQEEEDRQERQEQPGVSGGLAQKTSQKSVQGNKQQYRQPEYARRQQTTRNDKIISTLLHPNHRLGFGVWETSKGEVNVCGKGIGIGIRDQVVDTLFQAIKNATPATNKFQHATVPSFPQGPTRFNSMDPQDEKTWKDGIRSLLDLSAWKRVADIGLESRASIEHIEVDKLLLCNNPKHLTCTSMVACIEIWLNWHNPGDYPACPACVHCANALVGACVPPY